MQTGLNLQFSIYSLSAVRTTFVHKCEPPPRISRVCLCQGFMHPTLALNLFGAKMTLNFVSCLHFQSAVLA